MSLSPIFNLFNDSYKIDKINSYLSENHCLSFNNNSSTIYKIIAIKLINDYNFQKTISDFGRQIIDKQCDYIECIIIERLCLLLNIDYTNNKKITVNEPVYDIVTDEEYINVVFNKLYIHGDNINKLYSIIEDVELLIEDNQNIEKTIENNNRTILKIERELSKKFVDINIHPLKRKYKHNSMINELCNIFLAKKQVKRLRDNFMYQYST